MQEKVKGRLRESRLLAPSSHGGGRVHATNQIQNQIGWFIWFVTIHFADMC